jgi:hypothetical protein
MAKFKSLSAAEITVKDNSNRRHFTICINGTRVYRTYYLSKSKYQDMRAYSVEDWLEYLRNESTYFPIIRRK